MSDQFAINGTITYTPPLAATNSGAAQFSTQGVYEAQSVGAIDVTTGATIGTQFQIPFGSIAAAAVVIVKNSMTTPINIFLNGHAVADFELQPGAQFRYESPTNPQTTPITSVTAEILASPTSVQRLFYWIFGS
jgi:hypothetical protein